MEWMLLPYRRYAEFTGRSRRKEFWLFALFQWLVMIVLAAFLGRTTGAWYPGYAGFYTSFDSAPGMISNLFWLLNFIPNLAVSVRRLHDQDRSGWLLLLMFVPVLGWFALFVMFCLNGTRGPNRFGPDPKNPTDIDAFT
ncbi:DUF805 domain-containing protein [Novosphingobium flavum]|uniref:DUF805 domain-containing protein n=1 Tax=Novosphingobium flavum TaxID=1778672 RepID=A0A7X1FSI1_9SPHN|nr:DUF805 domain-containing protein [Novosphingobium flavum]MBC2666166.1 DUF805 domain-containing protein [Novosphingobium flavum]